MTFKGKNSTQKNKISNTKIIIQAQALRRMLLVMTMYKFVHTKYLSHLTQWVLDRWHWCLTNCNTCEWYVLQRKFKLHTDSRCESDITHNTHLNRNSRPTLFRGLNTSFTYSCASRRRPLSDPYSSLCRHTTQYTIAPTCLPVSLTANPSVMWNKSIQTVLLIIFRTNCCPCVSIKNEMHE